MSLLFSGAPPAPPPSPVIEPTVLNIHNLPSPEIDRCVICLETLNSKPTYSLPECNHTFHQNCIMHWFRQGNFIQLDSDYQDEPSLIEPARSYY